MPRVLTLLTLLTSLGTALPRLASTVLRRWAEGLALALVSLVASSALASTHPVKLVVLVVVDQLTSEHLDRYQPLLSGGIGRMMARGAVYRQARYAHANTETGPGHATIATGAWADVHGIVGNKWVDRSTGALIRCVEDTTYGNSPKYQVVPGIADAMKLATRGKAKVVAISHKPRSSVLLGGRRPDLVVWYDADKGRFSPGRWPGVPSPPSWYSAAQLRTGPERASGVVWDRYRADIDYNAWAEPDDRPFENDYPGLGRTFPRRLGTPAKLWPKVYPMTPVALDDVMTLARAAIEGERLGQDDTPDLLYLGISLFDYVGHAFGPGSQESLDVLLRIDAALGQLQETLSERLGAGGVLTVVTSDHGVMPMPEAARAHGVDAARLPKSVFRQVIGSQLRELNPPRLYLRSSARPGTIESTLKVRRALARKLAARPEILEAYVPEDVDRFAEPYRTFYRRLLYEGRTPDILFRHPPYHYVSAVGPDGTGQGTGHGSPYVYDQTVPILLHGPGIRPGVDSRPVMMTRVAPTIAVALGIAPPAAAYAPALPAVMP